VLSVDEERLVTKRRPECIIHLLPSLAEVWHDFASSMSSVTQRMLLIRLWSFSVTYYTISLTKILHYRYWRSGELQIDNVSSASLDHSCNVLDWMKSLPCYFYGFWIANCRQPCLIVSGLNYTAVGFFCKLINQAALPRLRHPQNRIHQAHSRLDPPLLAREDQLWVLW